MRMTEKELENRLKKAIEKTTPDVLDRAKSSCRNLSVAPRKALNTKRTWRYIAAAAAAVFLLAIGTVMGTFINKAPDNKVFATVSIDVNPSLEIKINKEEKVLSVIPLNDDAKKVVGDMDFSGVSMELTVNALIGSMYRLGYLDDEHRTVLVSLDNEDAAKAAYLLDELTAQISSLTEANNGRVIPNTYESTASLKEIAERYNVPESKASLIARLLAFDPSWEDQPLGFMSIEYLSLLVDSAEAGMYSTDFLFEPTDGQLSLQEAFERALGHAEFGYIEIIKAEYNGGCWLITSAASASGEPDVRIKTAVCGGTPIYFIEFGTLKYDYYITIDGAPLGGAAVAAATPRTGQNPILQENTDFIDEPPYPIPVGPDAASRAAVRYADIGEGELSFPVSVELITEQENGFYIVKLSNSGTDLMLFIDAARRSIINR
jgi:hypothetical protein